MNNVPYIRLSEKDYIPGEVIYEFAPSVGFIGVQIVPSTTPFELAIQASHFYLLKREERSNNESR